MGKDLFGSFRVIFLSGMLGFTLSCAVVEKPVPERPAPAFHLVVLHTNDHHGRPAKFLKAPVPGVGGLPARASLVKGIRQKNKNVLLLDAGDLNTGLPVSNLFHARPDIEGYNALGYDAMAIGNHEFDITPDILQWQIAWAHFPFLSANVKNRHGENLGRPYIIKNFKGFRVAVFGLTTKRTEFLGNPENIKDFTFEDEIEVARKLVPKLRKQADIVIALIHMGIYDTMDIGSERLASNVRGIDLIVDGHSHTRLEAPLVVKHQESDWKTPIVQAWKWGFELGRVDLWVKNRKVVRLQFKPIPINLQKMVVGPDGKKSLAYVGQKIREDELLLGIVQPYLREAEAALSEIVGYVEETFSNRESRNRETALGDLVADSMLWYTRRLGVDFAFQNGGGIRADLPRGNITKASTYAVLPFNNRVYVLTMKGSELLALFDYVGTIADGRGAFPQVSEGVNFTMNRETGKCEDILIGGDPIDPDRFYKIATNQYLARGGDGYRIFLSASKRQALYETQKNVLNQYIKAVGGRISPKVHDRIHLIVRGNKNESNGRDHHDWERWKAGNPGLSYYSFY
ncbi:MAG: 5'-nucleotidase C-terminal domain-containing protein [Deltaproteobacteria bacterium]|nr:5'-nucleotidase C-terminal domain-containing protein [Deltaproteobacteria bacterium]